VVSHGRQWAGALELGVELDDGTALRALAYPELVGTPEVGDRVLLNVSAWARGLGTGGYAMVIAIPDRLPADPPAGPGHLVKARYTPLQAMVLGVDDQESEHHDAVRDRESLDGMPVVVADLHSAVPAIIAGIRSARAAENAGDQPLRVVYVMTDGGALPAWFSRTVSGLRDSEWIVGCVTTGQAFGGDLEAVTVHTGLLAARAVLGADIAIVTQGPGNLGTGTRWGFSGVAAGEALNAAAVLGGRGIGALRVSGADERDRHLGISHHSLTAYGKVALAASEIVVPDLDEAIVGANLAALVVAQSASLGAPVTPHTLVREVAGGELMAALETSPVGLSTMGRGLTADPAAFLASAAAGRYAAGMLG